MQKRARQSHKNLPEDEEEPSPQPRTPSSKKALTSATQFKTTEFQWTVFEARQRICTPVPASHPQEDRELRMEEANVNFYQFRMETIHH